MDKVLYTDYHSATTGTRPCGKRCGQPLIGLSVNVDQNTSRLHEAYIRSVLDAGGIPLLIPAATDTDALRELTDRIDGLILTGGGDVDGRYFGEATLPDITDIDPLRDAYDFLLLRLASDRQIPVLGICRGAQVINIALGGNIWQDIPSQYPIPLCEHRILFPREKPVHPITIASDSILRTIFGKETTQVNSRHHQAIKQPAPGFRISAVAPDGIIEAIEGYPFYRMLGVQWHPENMATEGQNTEMKSLFDFFISEACLFSQAKSIHSSHLIVDSHCDTPMLFAERSVDIGRRDPVALTDLAKMAEGRVDAAFTVAYIPQDKRDPEGHAHAKEQAVGLLEEMRRQLSANAAFAGQAATFADAEHLKRQGRRAIFLGIENAYAMGNDLENLRLFQQMGVVYITLCHNGNNDLCDSARGEAEHGGLSPLGREAVREMNRLGLVIDLSHAAESTFYDVLQESRQPVICSHSSAGALCDHSRNLTDEQIRAIAAHGGVVQICLYGGFLVDNREATLMDAIAHLEHIIAVAGVDYVGIGSDFDGDGGINGCRASNELINLTVELIRRGYSEQDLAKIWGGNLLRVVDTVQRSAQTPVAGLTGNLNK